MANPRFPGVEVRHARSCPAKGWERCSCKPKYRGVVYSKADKRRIQSPGLATPQAAARWRQDAQVDLRRGVRRAVAPVTVAAVRRAVARGRQGGDDPQPLGRPLQADRRCAATSRRSRAASAARPRRATSSASSTAPTSRTSPTGCSPRADAVDDPQRADARCARSAAAPSRAARSRSTRRRGLELPGRPRAPRPHRARRRRRRRCSRPARARPRAVGDGDVRRAAPRRAARARWEDVDLAARRDPRRAVAGTRVEGPVEPKSRAGRRKVPIAAVLRDHLVEHRLDWRSAARRPRLRPRARRDAVRPAARVSDARRPGVAGGRASSRSRCTSAATRSRR